MTSVSVGVILSPDIIGTKNLDPAATFEIPRRFAPQDDKRLTVIYTAHRIHNIIKGRSEIGIWNSWAESIRAVASGDGRGSNTVKAVLPLVLYIIIALFIAGSFWLDKWLGFPVFRFTWWGIGLSSVLLALGIAIDAWIIVTFRRVSGTPWPFKPTSRLVTTGIYACLRNPMVLAGILIGEGLGFLLGSLSLILIVIPLLTLLGIFYLKLVEERELELRFDGEYLEYKKKVPMLIPKLRR